MSVRGAGMAVCLVAALIGAAQVRSVSAQFMQEMTGSMERMDRRMSFSAKDLVNKYDEQRLTSIFSL